MKIFWAVLSVIVVTGGIAAWVMFHDTQNNQVGQFQFAEIARGDLENIISSTGTLSAVGTVNVGAQVSGILETVQVDFNDNVRKGQVLAILERNLFEASVRDAEAGVTKAGAQLEQAKAEYARNNQLFEKGFLSEMEFLVVKTNVETAKASLESAAASLNRAKTNLEYTVIRSPIDGTVIERSVDPGQTIASSLQTPKLFIIAQDLARMQIEVFVDESDIGQIRTEQPVRFTVQAYPDETFTGVVRQVRLMPETVQNVVNYTVVVDAPNNTRKLLPGMTATVDFIINERHDVLLVPNTALQFKPDRNMQTLFGSRIREKMQQGDREQRTGSNTETGFESRAGDYSRLFYMESDGVPNVAIIRPGITNGMMTEIADIIRGPSMSAGFQVITGFSADRRPGFHAMPLGGPPPGGPGLRRAGF